MILLDRTMYLLLFLESKNALDSFLDNFENSRPMSHINGITLIAEAYPWANTPEGHEYWSVLDKECRQYARI